AHRTTVWKSGWTGTRPPRRIDASNCCSGRGAVRPKPGREASHPAAPAAPAPGCGPAWPSSSPRRTAGSSISGTIRYVPATRPILDRPGRPGPADAVEAISTRHFDSVRIQFPDPRLDGTHVEGLRPPRIHDVPEIEVRYGHDVHQAFPECFIDVPRDVLALLQCPDFRRPRLLHHDRSLVATCVVAAGTGSGAQGIGRVFVRACTIVQLQQQDPLTR